MDKLTKRLLDARSALEAKVHDLKDLNANLRDEVKRLTALVSTVAHNDAKQLSAMHLQNSEMKELLGRFAKDSAKCQHMFEAGSKHVVPDDCVFLVCQAATLLKTGRLKRDLTEKPVRLADDGIRQLDECGQVKCETPGCNVWHNPEWSDGTPRYGCSAKGSNHEEENKR